MSNLATSMPIGRTSFEAFVFEHFGAYIDLSHDGSTVVLALGALVVPLVILLKPTLS